MSKIAEAYVEISARMDRMDADLRTAHTKFDAAMGKMQKSSDALAARMTNLKASYGMVSGIIAGAFVGAITSAIKTTADHLDQLDEMSSKTGVSVEMLTSLELAAKKNGITMDNLATSIRMMYRSMNEAASGTKDAVDSYKRLGVNVKDASGNIKSGNEAFLEVADAISKIQNPAERSAMAMKVFGRAGADMIPMLEGGREALQGYIDEAKRLGLVFTDADAKRAAAFNDTLDAFNAKLRNIKERIAMETLPALTKLFAMLTGSALPDATKRDVLIDEIDKKQREIAKLEQSLPYDQKLAESPKSEMMRGFYETRLENRRDELRRLNNTMLTMIDDYNALDEKLNKRTGTPDKTPPLAGTASRIASNMRTANFGDEKKAKMLFDAASMIDGIGEVKHATMELVPAFQEVQASIIDTSVTLTDKLVAPFEDMMFNVGDMWSQTMADFIREGGNWGDFMKDMFADVFESFANMVGQMAARWMANQLFGSITGFNLGGGIFGAGAEVASTGLARMGGGTSIIINAVDTQSFDDALRRNSASVNNIVYEARRYGRES